MLEKKYIVSESQLMQLFKFCSVCHNTAHGTISQTLGTLVNVDILCDFCSHSSSWHSQAFVGAIPSGNLAVSSAILFAGALPTKILRFMQFMNVATISNQTFFNHQRHFLYPAIIRIWTHQQTQYINRTLANGEPVVIGGDSRADTPGHSAKFGSYSMVDLNKGIVVDIQLVQSNEIKSSNAMEKEGLVRGLKWLKDNNLPLETIVTDQHCQIVKYLREAVPDINHYFDVWHVAKGVKKKLVKLSQEIDCAIVGEWIRSITNHLYWTAVSISTSGGGEEMLAKWLSVANHVQNIHTGHSDKFPSCAHGELEGQQIKKKWLKQGTKACVKVDEILTATRLKTSIRKLSPIHQTSDVEAFHSTINHFAPKLIGFSFHGLYCRLLLAALHFNENSCRQQATTEDGAARYSIHYPKYKKGGYIAREKKTDQTFEYVHTLLNLVNAMAEKSSLSQDPYQSEHQDHFVLTLFTLTRTQQYKP